MSDHYLIEKKFILVLVAIIISTAMLWFGRVTGPSYENMLIWLTGIFVLGEAASGWVQALNIKAYATAAAVQSVSVTRPSS